MNLGHSLLLCLAATLSSAFLISPPHSWTKLILTHHWPNTFCSMSHCHANLSYWTLHGLWPDKGSYCNSSWHFNSSEIEDLLPDMHKSWPDLLKPSSTIFWKHEWSRHGTCAAISSLLNTQHKYFSQALELYHKIDLNSILMKFNIIPSQDLYNFSHIEGVLENFYGVKLKIQCAFTSRNTDVQTLGQLEICFNSDLTLLDCEKEITPDMDIPSVQKESGFKVCDHDVPVYYPPLS